MTFRLHREPLNQGSPSLLAQEVRMKLTGHMSAEMNAICAHHGLEQLRAAVARIPAVGV